MRRPPIHDEADGLQPDAASQTARRARHDILLARDESSAQRAQYGGIVDTVVPRAQLRDETPAPAQRIARKPPFALKLVTKAINGSPRAQGRDLAMQKADRQHRVAYTRKL